LSDILRKTGYPVDIDLAPVTDDKPFPFNIYTDKSEVKQILFLIIGLSLILIIPVFFLLLNNIGKYRISLLKCLVFTAAAGFGYMMVEIVLMQKFQKFIGNPNYTLITILGGLLFFGGIGSFISRYMTGFLKIIFSCLIPVFLLLNLFFLDDVFLYFSSFSFNIKLILSVLIIMPLGFLMGIPFPNALEIIKKYTSKEFGALMFSVSGCFSTIASTASILINVSYGFSASFLTGLICYITGLIFFILIMNVKKN
jgi:predicted membrane-bound spermidine synthase